MLICMGINFVFHGYLNGQVGPSYPRGMYAISLSASGTTLTLGDLYRRRLCEGSVYMVIDGWGGRHENRAGTSASHAGY